jgi:rhamnosyltransferase subunit B
MAPFVSPGDVYPFVAIGQALKERGHRVTVIANEYYKPLVMRVGLEFVALAPREEFVAITQDPDLFNPVKGIRRSIDRSIARPMRKLHQLIADHYIRGQTVMAAAGLAFGARIAHDRLGVPLVTIHLQPACFRSVYTSAKLPLVFLPDLYPTSVKRFVYQLIDLGADRLFAPATNAFRSELELPPVRRLFAEWWHSPQRIIGLFPEWFAPFQPDWPPQTLLTGFPRYDQWDGMGIQNEVENFLHEGDPPVVFTAGSLVRHARKFFAASAEACRLLGRRGILLTRYEEQVPRALPHRVRHFAYIPFGYLLPRAAALVHHGGIGTMAQAFAAGTPQVVMPRHFDQPDNAIRATRLGVATVVKPRSYRSTVVARALESLISSSAVTQRCHSVARKCYDENCLENTCLAIEQLGVQALD